MRSCDEMALLAAIIVVVVSSVQTTGPPWNSVLGVSLSSSSDRRAAAVTMTPVCSLMEDAVVVSLTGSQSRDAE